MGYLGEKLKTARDAKGVTLTQAEEETKIRRRYLEALENEEYDIIPGVVYTKGFLKTYAAYLGLDIDEIMTDFKLLNIREEKPERPQVKFQAYTTSVSRRKRKFKWKPAWLTVILAAAAIITLLLFDNVWNNDRGIAVNPSDNKPKTDVNENAGGRNNPPPAKPAKSAVPNSVYGSSYNQPLAQQNPAAGEQMNLVLAVRNQDSWVQVNTDGVNKFSGTMKPGQVMTFNARDRIYIKLGNAGAVEVTYNGQNLGFLGPLGTVVPREFTRTATPIKATP